MWFGSLDTKQPLQLQPPYERFKTVHTHNVLITICIIFASLCFISELKSSPHKDNFIIDENQNKNQSTSSADVKTKNFALNLNGVCAEIGVNRSVNAPPPIQLENGNQCFQNVFCQPSDSSCITSTNRSFKESTRLKGHLKPFGESGVNIPVEEIEGFPNNLFLDFVLPSVPLLMKGAAKLSPHFHKLTTDEYLLQLSSLEENREFEVDVEVGKKEKRGGKLDIITFLEFLNTYNKTDIYLVSDLHMLPFLEPLIMMPCPLQCPDLNSVPMKYVMWFSSGGTKSVVHHDTMENINCLYRGNKSLIFLDPSNLENVQSILDSPQGGFSEMDVDSVDLKRYSELQGVEFVKADMVAGDCVYIPDSWIHQVRSTGSNLAVNVWFDYEKTHELIEAGYCNERDLGCDTSISVHDVDHPYIEGP